MIAARAKTGWLETRRDLPCAGCGKGDGWCSVSADGTACLCRRGAESKYPVKQKDGTTAYLHPMTASPALPGRKLTPKPRPPKLTAAELRNTIKQQQTGFSPRRRTLSARALGLDDCALDHYGAGWDDLRHAVAFPMYDGDQTPIGIRLRTEDGRKLCVPGSQNGLFIPREFDVAVIPEPVADFDRFAPTLLLTPEGPTDCAAAWQVGFNAVGRPSCNGGVPLMRRLLERCAEAGAPRDVVVVADADVAHWNQDHTPYWPGWEGALELAAAICDVSASVRVIKPPAGKKDLRALLRDNPPADPVTGLGTAIVCAIEAAHVVKTEWLSHQKKLLCMVKTIAREKLRGRRFDSDASRDAARSEAEREAKGMVRAGTADAWIQRNVRTR